MKLRNIQLAFLLYACLAFVPSFAQNTLYYTEPDQLYRNGIEFFEKNNYIAARNEFDEYLKNTSQFLQENKFTRGYAQYYLVMCALYLNYPDAEILAERFAANNPEHPKAATIFKELGNYYYNSGEYGRAVVYLRKAIRMGMPPTDMEEAKFKLAFAYMNNADEKSALPLFNDLKESDSEDYAVPSSYYAGTIEFKNGDYDAAVADFKRIENVGTYRGEIPTWIAFALHRQGKYDEMLTYTTKILDEKRQGNKMDEVALITAEVFFQRADYEKAAKYYSIYDNYRGQNILPTVQYRYGYSLYKSGSLAKATEQLKNIATQPDTLGQYSSYIMGICYLKLDNPNYALGAFDQAAKGNFNPAIREEAIFNHAKVQLDVRNADLAIKEFQTFLAMYPQSRFEDEANNLIADAYLQSNNYPAALAYIEKLPRRSNSINTAYQKIAFKQAVNDYNQDRNLSAISYFDKSLSVPMDANVRNAATFWKAEAYSAEKKFDTAIPFYQQVLASNDASPDLAEMKLKSRYGLAYSYLVQKNYEQANAQFRAYAEALKAAPDRKNYEDALIRLGDTFFVQNKFQEALEYYNQAITQSKSDKDYALLQKGNCYIYLDDDVKARQAFDQLQTQFPNSRFTDDAILQTSVMDKNAGKYPAAIAGFSKLIAEKPQSQLIPNALLQRAICYKNVNQADKAMDDYKNILKNYPNSPLTEPALQGLEAVSSELGRNDEFNDVLTDYKKKRPEDNSTDGIEYTSAKNLYLSERYDKAIPALQSYIRNYPYSANVYEAKYLLADSYARSGNKLGALQYYYQVIQDNKHNKVNVAANRAADIEFSNANYPRAVTNYRTLLNLAGNKKDVISANTGLMQSYYAMSRYDSTLYFCQQIYNSGDVVAGSKSKARLYAGKIEMARNNYQNARQEFEQVIFIAKDENGAEAKYNIAVLLNKQRKFKESNDIIFDLNDQFDAYEYWRGMGFLLLADNYMALNENFQARKTLESIIDNAENVEVKTKAREKLRILEQFEKQGK
jgi:tetratricopeptide (TPR) repeat protein